MEYNHNDRQETTDFILIDAPKTEDGQSTTGAKELPMGGVVPPTNKKRRTRKGAAFGGMKKSMAGMMVGCVLLSGALGFGGGMLANQVAGGKTVMYQSVAQATAAGTSDSTASTTEKVASSAANSVVEIKTEAVTKSQYMQDMVTEGAGSGVIVSADGYIVTNNHVINGASKITVTTKDEKSYEATLVGTDSESDVALLKISASNLQPVVMGNSEGIVVGQQAIAIGNPLGELGGTVTDGIISALNREITIDGETMNLLQTDTAINPGNSGGGLFNASGELIGLVVAKSSGTGVEGLGFAIPVNEVKSVVEALMSDGYVKGRASLGVTLVDVDSAETAMQYRVNSTGVYISQVTSGGPAANAGLQSGDRIVSVGGTAVSSAADVKQAIRSHSVGDTIEVKVSRNGSEQTMKVTLGEYQGENTSSTSQQ
ncbi:S1C family serine protease [Eubacterium aggregans]|uniref:S1C family serine protease n=1 Tax=Eubacterium aggregans TaxID=81409 RepID=UPI0023F3B475|nr:trypsin-like peptidase domain-containing protein [Eubacterium aggregans]MDD4692094.1 trypsin-like peptidase domain-containing protein [Eubacterium aggregans]